jgi:Tfp pilus assembly protein PilN
VIQQINLYAESLKQQQKNAVIKLYLTCMGVVFLIWLGFSAYLLLAISGAETELQSAQLQLKNEQLKANLLPIKTTVPAPALNIALLAEIKQLQGSISGTKQIIELLADSDTLLLHNFSSYFQALAAQFDPEVWITAIHIAGKNRNLSLEGSTFIPEKVPKILDKLLQDPTFKGQSFDKFFMQPSPNKPQQTDFTLRSSKLSGPVKAYAQ